MTATAPMHPRDPSAVLLVLRIAAWALLVAAMIVLAPLAFAIAFDWLCRPTRRSTPRP